MQSLQQNRGSQQNSRKSIGFEETNKLQRIQQNSKNSQKIKTSTNVNEIYKTQRN